MTKLKRTRIPMVLFKKSPRLDQEVHHSEKSEKAFTLQDKSKKPAQSQGPSLYELKWMSVVARKQNEQIFYDLEKSEHLQTLKAASGITMLGNTELRKDWKGIVYKSNEDYGFGLIAKQDIKKGEEIAPYLGHKERINPEKEYTERQNAYAFGLDANHSIFADEMGSIAAFTNHSETLANIYASNKDGKIKFMAACDIPAGAALLINYGISYPYPSSLTYLCPYQNGRSPAENYKQYQAFFDIDPRELTPHLKRLFDLDVDSGHYVIPKIYNQPNLTQGKNKTQFIKHKHLPVYLMKEGMILNDQPYIFPLMLACALKDFNKVKQLVRIGADVFASTKKGLSVLKIITDLMAPEDSENAQYKEAIISILSQIWSHYKTIYTKNNFGFYHTTEELKKLKIERLVSYVNEQVTHTIALDLISKHYQKFKFKSLKPPKQVNSPDLLPSHRLDLLLSAATTVQEMPLFEVGPQSSTLSKTSMLDNLQEIKQGTSTFLFNKPLIQIPNELNNALQMDSTSNSPRNFKKPNMLIKAYIFNLPVGAKVELEELYALCGEYVKKNTIIHQLRRSPLLENIRPGIYSRVKARHMDLAWDAVMKRIQGLCCQQKISIKELHQFRPEVSEARIQKFFNHSKSFMPCKNEEGWYVRIRPYYRLKTDNKGPNTVLYPQSITYKDSFLHILGLAQTCFEVAVPTISTEVKSTVPATVFENRFSFFPDSMQNLASFSSECTSHAAVSQMRLSNSFNDEENNN